MCCRIGVYNCHRRPLPLRLLCYDCGGYAVVLAVEVADRLVEEDEVERLADSAYDSHALLLPYRHLSHGEVRACAYPHAVEPAAYLLVGGIARQVVLQLDVLQCRQFREQGELLRQVRQMPAAYLLPLRYRQRPYVNVIKAHHALIVLAAAEDVGAQARLARAAGSLYQVAAAALKAHVALPYFRFGYLLVKEHPGERPLEADGPYLWISVSLHCLVYELTASV